MRAPASALRLPVVLCSLREHRYASVGLDPDVA